MSAGLKPSTAAALDALRLRNPSPRFAARHVIGCPSGSSILSRPPPGSSTTALTTRTRTSNGRVPPTSSGTLRSPYKTRKAS